MKPEEGPSQVTNKDSGEMRRGTSIVDLVLRIFAIFGTLGSTIAMGTTYQTLPFSTQAVIYQAQYDDIPTFRFFVIASAIVCGGLAISLPVSIYHVIRTKAMKSRALLIFFDTIMLAVLTAGSSSAAAVVYLAHKGNASANWLAICRQYRNFCERITVSLIGSFGAVIILILLIPWSGFILSKQW
ncbi:CASP-like protein 1A1 [Striga hermonthica]|uniref:CASP-like protein n=1 Tax=Striga hermonthica TaxID=68872 RepID=A0A9N7NC24_STRHE|nr:CASP-like protein 1A1 [Striga hermonthica]